MDTEFIKRVGNAIKELGSALEEYAEEGREDCVMWALRDAQYEIELAREEIREKKNGS
jgi:hypothetical protein